jgi:methionyl-tRNA formyltransferase
VAAVTQPDRPRGRGQKPSPGAVKALARARGVPVLQPERLKDEPFLEQLRTAAPDIGVVAAYGKILPQVLLEIPRLGLVNVHASLLPRWRGASPVHRAVMAGDPETGVSIMRVVRELDAGGVFSVARRPILPNETSGEVERELARIGAELLVSTLAAIESDQAHETPQDQSGVSYAPRLTKQEGLIAWQAPAQAIHNQVRGLHPWPHAFTFLDDARVIVLRTALARPDGTDAGRTTPSRDPAPGEVVLVEGDHLAVAAGDGRLLHLLQVQLEGRRAVSGREFAAGSRLKPGQRFGVWP